MATQKLASLGTLAAGVAHELNSPLQVITGVSETLLISLANSQPPEVELLRDRIDAIKRNAWRCAEISGALRTYALASTELIETHDLNSLVHDTLLLMESQWHEQPNLRVVTDLAPGMPPLPCDRNSIMQALMNLLSNARDALPRGGEIRVSTAYDGETRHFRIQVADTGVGIPEAARSRIFDPFFTTKPLGQGTGLGLSILSGIVSAHGGRVEVDSTPGHGTVFTLILPQDPPLAAEPGAPPHIGARFDDTVVSWP
jgi:two-component system NtrC family sensor kinase